MILHTQIVHRAAVLLYLTSVALTTSNIHGMSVLAFAAVGARSHQFCVFRIGQALAARGHNFTLLISDQDDLNLDNLGSTALFGLDLATFRGSPFVGTDLWNQQRSRDLVEGFMQDISLQEEMLAMALALYTDKDTLQKLLAADYDVLLKDAMYWPASLLEDALDIPNIDVFCFAPLQPIFGDYASIPHPAAYLPQLGSGLTTNMNFLQRCQNYLYKDFGESGPIGGNELYQKKFLEESGLKVQTYEQGYSSSVAGISAGNWAIEFPHAMAPKVHLVGPISAEPAKALPADLGAFVEGGQVAGQGTVYVSMGPAFQLTEAELRNLAGSLSALPNPVLWKLAPQDLQEI